MSLDDGHVPLLIVQTNVLVPTDNPVTPEVGELGVVTVALPAMTVHVPVPTVGVFPASVVVVAQTVWSNPAAAAVGDWSLVIVTVSLDDVHVPLLIVQTNVFAPTDKLVTPDVGLLGVVTVALPAMTIHAPIPTVGVLPARVAVVEQTVWSNPAAAAVGDWSLVIVTVSLDDGHVPLLIVQTNVFAPTINPVTPDVGLLGVVTVALPAITVHAPVPTVGVLPASVAVVAQTVWSNPAAAVVGDSSRMIVTVSLEEGHVPLPIVQTKVLAPTDNPVTPEVGELEVVTVALPAMIAHPPVPTVGVLPANVAVVEHTV